MSQKMIFVKSAVMLTPSDAQVDTIDGILHLTEPPEGRIAVRVVTSTDVERLAIQMEIA